MWHTTCDAHNATPERCAAEADPDVQTILTVAAQKRLSVRVLPPFAWAL